MLLTIILAAAVAVPVPKHWSCPSSYRSQASYCIPMDDRSLVAIPKVGTMSEYNDAVWQLLHR